MLRLELLEPAGDDPLLLLGHGGDGDAESRRRRTHAGALTEPHAVAGSCSSSNHQLDDGFVRVGDSPTERTHRLVPVHDRYRLPLTHRLVPVAADEPSADIVAVVQPLGAAELVGEPGRQVDVGHQRPHPSRSVRR